MPKVSFVVPTRNRIEWLPECLQGLLAQTVQAIEIIVVDDASTDGTRDFLNTWGRLDPRVRVIHNSERQGGGRSRNIGMNIANSPLIAVCDDDDVYPVERADRIIKWFEENPKSELVNFPYVQIGYFNEIIKNFDGEPFDHELFKTTGQITYFANPTVAFKKKSVIEIGGYPAETEKVTDDYQFIQKWLDAGKKIDFCGGEFLCMHRVLPDSMMAKLRGFDPKWVTK